MSDSMPKCPRCGYNEHVWPTDNGHFWCARTHCCQESMTCFAKGNVECVQFKAPGREEPYAQLPSEEERLRDYLDYTDTGNVPRPVTTNSSQVSSKLVDELRAENEKLKGRTQLWDAAYTAMADVSEFFTKKAEKLEAENAELKKDKARLNKLEAMLSSGSLGNGLALFPFFHNKSNVGGVDIQDLGDEDGSDLGEVISTGKTLREAIDAAQEGAK